ncbi:MAG: hypothetical protein H0W83_07465, partial [Planctomycetes bacterium]|nr:hypothetical protein [Planctomycetota bacterium]
MATLWQPGGSAIRRGIRISLLEAIMAGSMFAATETWLVPLLQQRLGAAAYIIGVLTVISQLGVVSLGVLARPVILWIGGYSQATIFTCWVQVVSLLGLSLPLYYPNADWAVPVAVSLSILHGLAGAIMAPAWLAWMGDLVPRPMMARYLAWRWRIFAPTKLVFGLVFALAVTHWPASQGPYGFQIVLLIAAVGRLASIWLLMRQHVPKPRPTLRGPESLRGSPAMVSLWAFVRTMHRTDIGRMTMVLTALSFGVLIAGPFFMSYMLEPRPIGLELDEVTYWWLVNTGTVTRFVMVAIMGHMVGLYGASALLRVAVIGVTVVPAVWAWTTNIWCLFAVEILSGTSWCAIETSAGVLLLSCNRDPAQRMRLIGYHQA